MRRILLAALTAVLALAAPAGAQAPPPQPTPIPTPQPTPTPTPTPSPVPHIAAAVTAAGVDVSGLTLPDAAARVNAAFAARLAKPLTVRAAGKRFRLNPAAVKLKLDAVRTARRAFRAGYAVGRPSVVDVRLDVTYSPRALHAFARQIAAKVAIAPRDARIHIALTHIAKLPARPGRSLDPARLRARLRAPLTDPAALRTMRVGTKKVKPKVTTAALARRYPTVITIDRGRFRLRLFKRLHLARTYRVAVGMPAYPTPTGLFSITNKAVNPAWTAPDSPWAGAYRNETVAGGSAANPLKARWMGIVNGVGIHGTGIPSSIGTAASHGCIRMTVPDVIDLYPRAPVGTPVLIGG